MYHSTVWRLCLSLLLCWRLQERVMLLTDLSTSLTLSELRPASASLTRGVVTTVSRLDWRVVPWPMVLARTHVYSPLSSTDTLASLTTTASPWSSTVTSLSR